LIQKRESPYKFCQELGAGKIYDIKPTITTKTTKRTFKQSAAEKTKRILSVINL
jgi:hypothetical protein